MGTRDEERAQQVVAVERFNGNVVAIQLANGKRVPAHVGYWETYIHKDAFYVQRPGSRDRAYLEVPYASAIQPLRFVIRHRDAANDNLDRLPDL